MTSLPNIALFDLLYIAIPVLMVWCIQYRWDLAAGRTAYAVLRMVSQLLLIGYVLTYIFESAHMGLVMLVLVIMMTVASWIALGPIAHQRKYLYGKVLLAVSLSGCLSLGLIVLCVLRPEPWFAPAVVIPLAGMVFSSCMNSVSLAAERYFSAPEGMALLERRNKAFNASLIPVTNSLFAVGLVALPGMMTGQILSGVSPLIAVRYQIMVMCMLLGASGLASALFLTWVQAADGSAPNRMVEKT